MDKLMDEQTPGAIDAEASSALDTTAPEAAALATVEDPVMRCDACGYDVTPDDGHICDRGGGRIVETHPRACAVAGCRVARRGNLLPSLSHHAGHMQWHIDRWEKQPPPPTAAAPAAAAAPQTVDRWTSCRHLVPAGRHYSVLLVAEPDAVCVAILFQGEGMSCLVAECGAVGEAPLGAYIAADMPGIAVVPSAGAPAVSVQNDGDRDEMIRVGTRWELRGDG